MVGRLIALRLPPDRFAGPLRKVWAAGDAVLPLPPDDPAPRIRAALERFRPATLVTVDPATGARHDTRLDRPRQVPEGTAVVVSTSGSTGLPKGVVISHRALESSTSASITRLGARPGDRFTLALPLHHVAGLQILLRSSACGTEARIVADPGDPAQLVPAPEASDPAAEQHISLVPTQVQRLVDLVERGGVPADALRRWRTILVGGAHLDTVLRSRAEALGATIVASYGMSETCGGCVYDGRPLRDVEVALHEDGRIRLRGPVLFSGYLDTADDGGAVGRGLSADGWFTTGDLGEFRGGRLHVLGRHDDVIVSGGENVPAQAVASILQQHPGVNDAAVVGVPDTEWGMRVVAVAVPRDPDVPPTLRDLRDHVAAHLPAGYAPRQLVLTSSVPRAALGKPSAAALRRLVEGAP